MKNFLSLVVTIMLMIKCTYADEMAPEVDPLLSSNDGQMMMVCIGIAVMIVLSAIIGIVLVNKSKKENED